MESGRAGPPPDEVTTQVGTDVLFENDRVRIWRVILAPGEATSIHKHLHDYLFVYADDSVMEVENFDGAPRTRQPSAEGFTTYREVGQAGLEPHQLHNVGEQSSTHYLVELLGPSRSDEARPQEDNRDASNEA